MARSFTKQLNHLEDNDRQSDREGVIRFEKQRLLESSELDSLFAQFSQVGPPPAVLASIQSFFQHNFVILNQEHANFLVQLAMACPDKGIDTINQILVYNEPFNTDLFGVPPILDFLISLLPGQAVLTTLSIITSSNRQFAQNVLSQLQPGQLVALLTIPFLHDSLHFLSTFFYYGDEFEYELGEVMPTVCDIARNHPDESVRVEAIQLLVSATKFNELALIDLNVACIAPDSSLPVVSAQLRFINKVCKRHGARHFGDMLVPILMSCMPVCDLAGAKVICKITQQLILEDTPSLVNAGIIEGLMSFLNRTEFGWDVRSMAITNVVNIGRYGGPSVFIALVKSGLLDILGDAIGSMTVAQQYDALALLKMIITCESDGGEVRSLLLHNQALLGELEMIANDEFEGGKLASLIISTAHDAK